MASPRSGCKPSDTVDYPAGGREANDLWDAHYTAAYGIMKAIHISPGENQDFYRGSGLTEKPLDSSMEEYLGQHFPVGSEFNMPLASPFTSDEDGQGDLKPNPITFIVHPGENGVKGAWGGDKEWRYDPDTTRHVPVDDEYVVGGRFRIDKVEPNEDLSGVGSSKIHLTQLGTHDPDQLIDDRMGDMMGNRKTGMPALPANTNIFRGISPSPYSATQEELERMAYGEATPADLLKHIDTEHAGEFWWHPDYTRNPRGSAEEFSYVEPRSNVTHPESWGKGELPMVLEAEGPQGWDPKVQFPTEPKNGYNGENYVSVLPSQQKLRLKKIHYQSIDPDGEYDQWHVTVPVDMDINVGSHDWDKAAPKLMQQTAGQSNISNRLAFVRTGCTYYHVSPTFNQDNILQNGIDYRQGEPGYNGIEYPPGNYLFKDKDAAEQYRQVRQQEDEDEYGLGEDNSYSLYEVNHPVKEKKDPFHNDLQVWDKVLSTPKSRFRHLLFVWPLSVKALVCQRGPTKC